MCILKRSFQAEKHQKNIYKLYLSMKKYKLDVEEKQILRDVEAGKFVSVPNVKEEIARIKRLLLPRRSEKTKNINIRLAEKDVFALKEKAAENSLPYQTLVATLIRQYLSGKFKIIL